MKRIKEMKKNQKGFTLVELIVVLVILAILAAVLVPALLGYIDKARKRRYLNNAKTAMDAAQAMLVEEYAKNGSSIQLGENILGATVATGKSDNSIPDGQVTIYEGNGDVDARKSQFAKNILSLIDREDDPPFCFFIGVGSNYTESGQDGLNDKVTAHDKYTVFYAYYKETKDAAPLYFYNGEWSLKNPRYNNQSNLVTNRNVFNTGPYKGKRIQYYLISETNEAVKYYGGSFSKNQGTMWGNLKKDNEDF